MVGPRRARNPKDWRNIKKQYKYSRLIESESETEENPNKTSKQEKDDKSPNKKEDKNIVGKGVVWNKKNTMSSSVRNSMNFLNSVAKKTSKKRRAILKEFGDDKNLFNALSELSHNLLKGNISLNTAQLKKLRRHGKILKALDCPKTAKCKRKRRQLIEQSGGFLPILIPAAAAALGHLSGVIIKKIIK
jgi:hypothetical protein